jgi:RNA polymerase sigma factor (sigma-70 family)
MISHFRREHPTAPITEIAEKEFAVSGGQEAVDDKELVKQLLTCLDNNERMLVAMKYRDGMRNVDIAAELGMNPSTVATVLAGARTKMRAKLEGSR